MSYEVDNLMSKYSSLSKEDQKEFDRRYKDSKKFSRVMNRLVKDFVAAKQTEDGGEK